MEARVVAAASFFGFVLVFLVTVCDGVRLCVHARARVCVCVCVCVCACVPACVAAAAAIVCLQNGCLLCYSSREHQNHAAAGE